jgi:tRNA (mo5U34)-methyltransferase
MEDGLMDRAQLEREVAGIQWFHSIDLGGGLVTPGLDDSPKRLERLRFPDDLTGKSVLDVGAWDGFFSFEAERRGAERVVAIDDHTWTGPGWASMDGFNLARRALGSKVEDRDIGFNELSPGTIGEFDLVLFLGVLYHMEHPWLILERVASVCRGLLIVETHLDMLGYRRPAAAFYPGTEADRDESNWWGPNPAAVEGMLRPLGFDEVDTIAVDRLPRRLARSAYRFLKRSPYPWRQGRGVFHARRTGPGG